MGFIPGGAETMLSEERDFADSGDMRLTNAEALTIADSRVKVRIVIVHDLNQLQLFVRRFCLIIST
jgi:hypothetical protein